MATSVLWFCWKVARFTERIIGEFREKEEWRKYKCGIYTDLDEDEHCPACTTETRSKIVTVRRLHLRWIAFRAKVRTKHLTPFFH